MTEVVMAAAKIDLSSEMVTRVKFSKVGGGYFHTRVAYGRFVPASYPIALSSLMQSSTAQG